MARTLADVVEELLRQAAASPRPWRPETVDGLSREQLDSLVRQLTEAGFLEPVPHEPGYRVSTPTRLLLEDPEALERFRQDLDRPRPARWELPANASPRQRVVHDTLHNPVKPRFNQFLIGVNVAVFLLGLVLALQAGGSLDDYVLSMQGNPVSAEARHRTGLLRFSDLTTGQPLQWVRLLTCCFVHFGVLHLAMNMYAQASLGRDVEWLWGRWRFLVIYLLSGFGGACTAAYVAFNVTWPNGPPGNAGLAGASGAICGLLGAEAVWLWLNRHCLPQGLAAKQLRGVGMTALLIGFISLLPGISGSAHFGGAAVGAVAAVLWDGQRFGNRVVQMLSIAGLVALPVLCVAPLLKSVRPAGEEPAALVEVRKIHQDSVRLDQSAVVPLIEVRAGERDPAQLQKALSELPALIDRLDQAARQVEQPEGAPHGVSDEHRQAARQYFLNRAQQYRTILGRLDRKEAVSVPEEQAFKKVQTSAPRWLD